MENQTQQSQSTIQQMPVQPTLLPVEPKTEAKKPLPKLKILSLIILLLLVLTVPFGGYLLLGKFGIHPKSSTVTLKATAPTPNPIEEVALPELTASEAASWKTYENKEEGWTIKYHSDKISYYSNRFYITGQNNLNTPDGFGPEVFISLTSNDPKTGKLTINGFPSSKVNINTPDKGFYQDFWYLISTKNGNKTIGYHVMSNKDMGLFDKNGNVIPEVSQENVDEMREIALKMLSTFKFTDQTTQTIDTTDWKTITAKGVSFKYPQNYSIKNTTGTYMADMENHFLVSIHGDSFPGFNATLGLYENTGQMSAKQFIMGYYNKNNIDAAGQPIDPELKEAAFKEIVFNGNKVTLIDGLSNVRGAGNIAAWLTKGSNGYLFLGEASSPDDINLLETIVSTFQFTQ